MDINETRTTPCLYFSGNLDHCLYSYKAGARFSCFAVPGALELVSQVHGQGCLFIRAARRWVCTALKKSEDRCQSKLAVKQHQRMRAKRAAHLPDMPASKLPGRRRDSMSGV